MRWRNFLVVLLISLLGGLFGSAGPARAEEVPCPKVMSQVNRYVTRRIPPDISDIAKKLKTKIVWVETCLKAYGRRYKRPGFESAGGRDEVLEEFEEGQDEEVQAQEDADEAGRQ